jgi:uncharacterized membrane protein
LNSELRKQFEIRPHCALDARGARMLVLGVAILSFSAASVVILVGAWPVLVFTGATVLAFSVALTLNLRAARAFQQIQITEQEVIVRFCEKHGIRSYTLIRCWTRVRLHEARSALHPQRLLLETHGRRIEVGSFLNESERNALSKHLAALIGPMGHSPTLSNGAADGARAAATSHGAFS